MNGRRLRGLALVDVVATVVVCAILAALLAVSRPRERALGQLGESMSNLREFGVAFEAYGRDNADLVATFGWRAGVTPSTYPDLAFAASDFEAAGLQAVDIMRRRGNLTASQLPRQTSWIPHISYPHLALIDYLATSAPWNTAASPGDANQLKWATDPAKWQENGAPTARHPFASSYELPPAYTCTPDSGPNAVYQASSHNIYGVPSGARFGGRRMQDVVYPSNKALMYERVQWFFGSRVAFFMYDEARVPVLAADGNVQLRRSAHSNPGWDPRSPNSSNPTALLYSPPAYEPPALAGVPTTVVARMRWTRRALAGRDFDATEVP